MADATFLERNKKKSLLALLLLLIRSRKEIWPLLVVALLMVSFIFVGPLAGQFKFGGKVWSALLRVPGFSYAAQGLELTGMKLALKFGFISGGGYAGGSFPQLMAAFKAARDEKAGHWASLWRSAAAKGSGAAAGSVINVVQLDIKALTGGGILTPEDAQGYDKGVFIAEGDLRGERAAQLAAQAAAGKGVGPSAGIVTYAGVGFFAYGRAQAQGSGIPGPGGDLPNVGVKQYPGSPGQQSELYKKATKTGKHKASNVGVKASGTKAFAQLNDDYVHNSMATAPRCRSTAGCPPEYATTNSGAVYDKIQLSGASEVLTSPTPVADMDGIVGNVAIPSDEELSGLQSNADQLVKDAEACRQADLAHHDNEQSLLDQIEKKCEQMLSAQMECLKYLDPPCKCGCCWICFWCWGECNKCKSKKPPCKQSKAEIDALMANYCSETKAHYNQCPFMQKQPYSCFGSGGVGPAC